MPWKECHVMDERLRFVARLLEGETMAALCEEFGISRKTGYKIYQRYRQIGVQGLTDRSRRPHRHANQLPMVVEKTIVRIKREFPTWGAPKIRERLRQRWPQVHCPAISTVHAVLDRAKPSDNVPELIHQAAYAGHRAVDDVLIIAINRESAELAEPEPATQPASLDEDDDLWDRR